MNLHHACTSDVHSSYNTRKNTVMVDPVKENEVGDTSCTHEEMRNWPSGSRRQGISLSV
jgi:hypothetical protein